MGWCSATEIIDAAIEGAIRSVAEAWQIASGNDFVKTPAYVNAINEDPDLQGRMDEVLRPFVRKIADKLRDEDWDCIDESRYYQRFGPEMQGMTDQEFRAHQAELYEGNPEAFALWLKTWETQNRGR